MTYLILFLIYLCATFEKDKKEDLLGVSNIEQERSRASCSVSALGGLVSGCTTALLLFEPLPCPHVQFYWAKNPLAFFLYDIKNT